MGVRITLALLAFSLQAQTFRQHTVATGLKGGYQVAPYDLNRDGRTDLIALASGMSELVWYENPGSTAAEWPRHVIAGGLQGMINVAAIEVERGAPPALVLAHGFANDPGKSTGIVSVLRAGTSVAEPWSVQEIDRISTSHRLRTARIGGGRTVVVNAPLAGARSVPPQYEDNVPLVFYDPKNGWKRETIGADDRGVVHGIFITDWNRDGRDDVLTASFLGIHVHEAGRQWTRKRISGGDPAAWPASGASDVTTLRAGKERLLASIEPWHGHQVVVYRHGQRQVIDTGLVDGHTILAADFDGDGTEEIVAGARGNGSGAGVFLYRRKGAAWEKEIVDPGLTAAACSAADLNDDGRPDLTCIGSATAELRWYENLARNASR